MKKNRRLLALFGGLVVALALVAMPFFSALALDTMPAPIDPQSWTLLRDTNWSAFKPNPVIDWMDELNTDGLYNSSRYAGGNATYGIPEHRKTPIKGAIIVVDFWDKPFLMLGEKGADLFGWHAFGEHDSYRDYLDKIERGDPVTYNPQRVVKNEEELLRYWEDYLNKQMLDPADNRYNHGTNADEFWREVSYGKWAVDLTAFGVFHLQGFEMEYGIDYTSMNDLPPTFRRGTQRNFVSESIAAANAQGVYVGGYDFFFICHSGYDESAVWMEFGPLQWANGVDVPYEYGVRAKMDELEVLLTAHPEYLVSLNARGGYSNNTIRDAAAQVTAGTFTEFKFPASDWAWANGYIGQTASRPGTPGGPNTAPTRYVRWTSWAAAATRWASSSGYGGGSFLNDRGQTVPSIPYSQQSESNGMATYVHEFGHIVNLPDNYSMPYSDTVSARSEPWDLMSRGCFAGPFGDHARWSVPGGLEADSVPVHLMYVSKKFSNFYDDGDIYALSVAQLKTRTPVVQEVLARNIPMNNAGYYPQLEQYGLKAPNFYKGIELTFDSANPDTATLVTNGWSNTRTRANRMSIEVVERTGYDSFAPDDGVIISRLTSGSGSYQVVSSHLVSGTQKMVDYYLNGAPVDYPVAHQVHLFDATFKAGKSFVDTGYYVGGEYKGDKRGIAGKTPATDEIISGNTVNEYYDAANKLHYYILARHDNPGKNSTFLSYSIGMLHDDGQPVLGDLATKVGAIEKEAPGRVAVANFEITNTGNATDIIRVGVAGELSPVILNDLYAIGAGETITVPVYVQLPVDIRTVDAGGKVITLNVSSESNKTKIGSASVKVEDLIKYSYTVYLAPHRNDVFFGETFLVDVMLAGDINYTQLAAEIIYDPNLLDFAGYQDLKGWAAAVTKVVPNKVAVRSVPGMNMVVGEPCKPAIKIVTLKFTVKNNLTADSIGTGLSFASAAVSAPGGVTGAGATPSKDVPLTLRKFEPLPDVDILRQFGSDDPHAGENCNENAYTVHAFEPNTIETMGVVDPFFAGGGTQFAPTNRPEMNLYLIAVEFADIKGGYYTPYSLLRNVYNDSNSSTSLLDLSKVESHYYGLFLGRDAVNACPKIPDYSANYKGMKQRMEEMSMGKWKVNVICLNEVLAEAMGLDPATDVWPWIKLEGPMMGYAVQGPSDCEDYRQFARVHQAGINAAYEQIEAAWAARGIDKKLDLENMDFIITTVPYNTHGFRAGLQGGSGLDTSFSYNDQALVQRDSEYRHEPGVKTRGGRVVGSGVFDVKGIYGYSPQGLIGGITTAMHEFTHGMGMFDDYSYGGPTGNTGESTGSGIGSYGIMGGTMNSSSPDLPAWRKYRMGWIEDDELQVVLPGDTVTLNLRAMGSYEGNGLAYTNPEIKTKLVVIPKEYRTRDTFGVNDTTAYGYPWLGNVWTNSWNPNRLNYNWYDWFTNPWVGGESNAIKSFPTFYALECRKAMGLDSTIAAAAAGVVVSYIANPTSETGHGAGGFKIVNASGNSLKTSGTATFTDPHIGLTVRVNSSNAFYDNVTITYTGVPTSAAQHTYMGILKASNNYVKPGQTFNVDFDIMTMGCPAPNDTANSVSATVSRRATPLGVPGGIAGFEMAVTYDAASLEYVPASASGPFAYVVSETTPGTLNIVANGNKMVDKDIICSLGFVAKTGAASSAVQGRITKVKLLNWRGEELGVGGVPGFNGVGTVGAGTFAAFHANTSNNLTNNYIQSFNGTGLVTVGPAPTYTVSGQIVCDTPGPAPGSFIGVESVVQVRSGSTVLGTAKSDWDGNYTIKGIPAGTGYTIYATKAKYNAGTSAAFNVAAATKAPAVKLSRSSFTVSGTIYGSFNSDGTGATPLVGVDVYLINIGNANSVIGGPVKTDALGAYTVTGWEVGRAYAAVAVSVKGTAYENLYLPQLYLAPSIHLPQASVTGPLEVNLGMKYGEHASDLVYPANSSTLGVANLYCFANTSNRTGRNITLTQTQDVRLRVTTKSTAVRYQLRDMDGNAVGGLVSSVGTTNGDDIIRNVPPGGPYYIEASRSGYISSCSAPFMVDGVRIILRNAQGTNFMDLQATGSGQTLAGTVYNAITGAPLEGVMIQNLPRSNAYGAGVPIFTAANGTFSYLTVNTARDTVFSKEGFATQTVYRAAGAASGLVVNLVPLGPTPDPLPGLVQPDDQEDEEEIDNTVLGGDLDEGDDDDGGVEDGLEDVVE